MARQTGTADVAAQVKDALAALEQVSTKRDYENLKRFGITAGWYEARMLASLVDEPEKVTPARQGHHSRPRPMMVLSVTPSRRTASTA